MGTFGGRSAYLEQGDWYARHMYEPGIAITNIMWSIMGILRNLVLKI